jgi:hypothetical protein
MVRVTQKARDFLARESMSEAARGNHWPLIGRVLSVPEAYLSDDERNFLRGLLERSDGRRGKALLKNTEKSLIGSQLQSETERLGKREAAIASVTKDRGLGRSSLFEVLKQSKKKSKTAR